MHDPLVYTFKELIGKNEGSLVSIKGTIDCVLLYKHNTVVI